MGCSTAPTVTVRRLPESSATGRCFSPLASTVLGTSFHFLPAADQRNACVMDGSDEVAAVIADVKLCLHIEILHRNVIGVFLVSI